MIAPALSLLKKFPKQTVERFHQRRIGFRFFAGTGFDLNQGSTSPTGIHRVSQQPAERPARDVAAVLARRRNGDVVVGRFFQIIRSNLAVAT